MKITKVKLENYRNYHYSVVEFSDGITLVSGANGQGKTNLVESLVLGSTTKSPRTSSLQETIRDGETQAFVEITAERSFGKVTLGYRIDGKGDKHFFVNGNEVKKLSEVFGNIVIIFKGE